MGAHDNHEGRSLSPEGSGAKAFRGTVCNTCLPRRFHASGNVTKYDGKTNPSIWLEDYHLTCRVGRANDDLFII
jgi:hypothetical protein